MLVFALSIIFAMLD